MQQNNIVESIDALQINNLPQDDIQDQLLSYSQDLQQQEKQKAAYKGSKIKDLFPTNYYEEMSQFFQKKCQYNPFFTYTTVIAQQVSEIHSEYEDIANKILINNHFAPDDSPILNEQEVLEAVNQYLQKIGLQDYVDIIFSNQCLSRTSVLYYKSRIVLKIRLPLSYTKVSLEGTLNHQIGTHIVRYLNHKENSERKPSKKSKIFQEGLAAINQLLPEQKPILFKAALRYNAVIRASKQSFTDVFKFINKYLKDQFDCWRQTVRAKRGQINTEKPGAYHKDQNYLIGAIDILRNRKKIDFEKCFYSKLSSEEGKNMQKGVLPPFMQNPEKRQFYLKKIEAMVLCNFIDSLDQQQSTVSKI